MPLLRSVARAVLRRGKYTKRQGDHGVISAKRGNKQYYKGNRGHKPGVHTNTGLWPHSLTLVLVLMRSGSRD